MRSQAGEWAKLLHKQHFSLGLGGCLTEITMPFQPETPDLPHDAPLREDVSRIGAMVGQMLAEQRGEAFFERVEAVRTSAIRRRREDEPVALLDRALSGMQPDEAEALARAFATYFQAVNIAERVHRIRRRRDYQPSGRCTSRPRRR